MLGGHPMKFNPGERFEYCNGGFVVLALVAEAVGGRPLPRPRRPASLRARRDDGNVVPTVR